jgi:hypothetical protein
MSYSKGGRNVMERVSDRPSWVGLEEISRDADFVTFKTRHGRKQVPVGDVEKWERSGR